MIYIFSEPSVRVVGAVPSGVLVLCAPLGRPPPVSQYRPVS